MKYTIQLSEEDTAALLFTLTEAFNAGTAAASADAEKRKKATSYFNDTLCQQLKEQAEALARKSFNAGNKLSNIKPDGLPN